MRHTEPHEEPDPDPKQYQEIVSGEGGSISTNKTVLREILLPVVIFLSWTSILGDLKKFRSLREKDQYLIILMIYYLFQNIFFPLGTPDP
jgi:hypothetical protein